MFVFYCYFFCADIRFVELNCQNQLFHFYCISSTCSCVCEFAFLHHSIMRLSKSFCLHVYALNPISKKKTSIQLKSTKCCIKHTKTDYGNTNRGKNQIKQRNDLKTAIKQIILSENIFFYLNSYLITFNHKNH